MNPLKKLRGERGLSLRELAKLAKVDQSTISLIENDRQKAQFATLGKLATALEVPIETFQDLVDQTASERGRKSAEARAKKESPEAA